MHCIEAVQHQLCLDKDSHPIHSNMSNTLPSSKLFLIHPFNVGTCSCIADYGVMSPLLVSRIILCEWVHLQSVTMLQRINKPPLK